MCIHTHVYIYIYIKAYKQSKTSTRIRSRIFKYILIHLFLIKTTEAKCNTEPHTRYRIPFAIISPHTFMSLHSKSFLNCFFPQYQRGDCITRGFQELYNPKFLKLFAGQLNIFQQKLLCEIMQMSKNSLSAI